LVLYWSEIYKNINAKLAFVSTNSICQGEQVSLYGQIFLNKIEIFFAYQSFKWKNNAKDNAGVTVVIIGLEIKKNYKKYLFIENIKKQVKNINAYLVQLKYYLKELINQFLITKNAKVITLTW
jgi:hypothetical protein